MNSKEKALSKAKGKVNNLVKGNEGKVDDKGEKPKKGNKDVPYRGAKNNDSEQD